MLDSAGIRAALQAVAPETRFEIVLGDRYPEQAAACVYFCCLELLPAASAIAVHRDAETIVFEAVLAETLDLSRVKDRVEAFGGRLTSEPGRVSGVVPT